MAATPEDTPCTMVIFGASGDLTRRKLMPALFGLHEGGYLPAGFTVVGYGRSGSDDARFRAEMHAGVKSHATGLDTSADAWAPFADRLHYASGQYNDPADLARLHERVAALHAGCEARGLLYYLALPPHAAEAVLAALGDSPLPRGTNARVMMEKPFGTDLESARRLNRLVTSRFEERQIYRIDHYLAKDTVRNLLAFRFTNAIFEPVWNRNYIDHVQITAAESIGVEDRGGYYERAGVVRDMLQNHVLQVLALVTMEPPLAGDEESVRDRKVEIFKSLMPVATGDYVLGQYDGYRGSAGVAPDSVTPTYAAVKLQIENGRWMGVPFYLRSGKALNRKVTEVVIQFKRVPYCALSTREACAAIQPNVLVLRIQPDEGISLTFNMQKPGHVDELDTRDLHFRYAELDSAPPEAYERVILDALRGRPSLFWRSDGIEAAWRAVTPLITDTTITPDAYPNYAPGSWGPAEADALLRRDGRQWVVPE